MQGILAQLYNPATPTSGHEVKTKEYSGSLQATTLQQ